MGDCAEHWREYCVFDWDWLSQRENLPCGDYAHRKSPENRDIAALVKAGVSGFLRLFFALDARFTYVNLAFCNICEMIY